VVAGPASSPSAIIIADSERLNRDDTLPLRTIESAVGMYMAIKAIATPEARAVARPSNVAPGLCRSMFLACEQGQIAKAQRLSNPITQLTYALFREPNPVPLKYALSLLGLMSPGVRLPVVELADQAKIEIRVVMAEVCDENAEDMIGSMCGPGHGNRRVVAG
jgi:Dihydrodipicolinate synthetase family